eukprot:gene12466-6216_t
MNTEVPTWEGLKENFQPLKKGRHPGKHRQAFQTLSNNSGTVDPFSNKKINFERTKWEEKIENYEGEDPLNLWLEYIRWIEDNYPSLGEQSDIIPVIERCTREFIENEKYKNDSMYLNLWLKYADLCSDPVDIYPYLYQHQVGVLNASLYIEWACYLEETGDSNSADKVIDKGIKIQAQPMDVLKKAQQHFQQREMNKLRDKLKMSNVKPKMPVQPKKPTRKVFNSLSSHEAKTGLRNVSNSTPGTAIPQMMLNNQPIKKLGKTSSKTNFKIYEENENPITNKKRLSFEDEFIKSKKIKTLASEKEKKKENVGNAEKWTSHQIKQTGPKKTVEKIHFKIFEDTDENDDMEMMETKNSKALKKEKKIH